MQYKKAVIGHNMIFDLGFIYRQFISAKLDLPKTYAEFAKQWRSRFPHVDIYDTKVLAQSCGQNTFGQTQLKYLFDRCKKEKRLCNNVVVDFDE